MTLYEIYTSDKKVFTLSHPLNTQANELQVRTSPIKQNFNDAKHNIERKK